MTQAARNSLAIVVLAMTVSLSGCVIGVPAPHASKSDSAPRADHTLTTNDSNVCAGFDGDYTKYSDAVKSNPPAAEWATAFQTLAFATNDRAFKADDRGKVQASLQALAGNAAEIADKLRTTSGVSTQENLGYLRAIHAVGDVCGFDYSSGFNFENNPK